MSKFTKLVNSPGLFFQDALRNRINPVSKSKAPAAKAPAAKPKPKPAPKKAPVAAISDAERKKIKLTGQIELLKSMVLDGEYNLVKRAWVIASQSDKDATELSGLLNVQAEAELAQAKHEQLMETGRKMIEEYNSPLGYFYRAQSLFVRGLYEEALHELQNLLRKSPNHADGVYLACEVFERLENTEAAWQLLERLVLVSKRNKSWHVMANLVQNNADIFRLSHNWHQWKTNKVGPAFHQDVSEFVALGGLRVKNFEFARSIWRETLFSAQEKAGGFGSIKKRKASYSSKRAESALSDLNKMFGEAGIEMFLVSGTLLGCVREGRLLGHDKDIDIGIWGDIPEEKVMELATTSGLFYVLKSRSPEIIRLRHVNGIPIDVFYHYKESDDYWHGGVKMIWHNSPFKLVEYAFLGENYLIPEDFDLYLKENYGEWRTPKIAFDSAFDTPNGEVRDADEMAIHSFKGLLSSCVDGNWEMAIFYLEKLEEFGEEIFVAKFKEVMATTADFQSALDRRESESIEPLT